MRRSVINMLSHTDSNCVLAMLLTTVGHSCLVDCRALLSGWPSPSLCREKAPTVMHCTRATQICP